MGCSHPLYKHEHCQSYVFNLHIPQLCGLTLMHDITLAHRANLKCGILLFDIRGFFDNVNHARLVNVMKNLGFPPEIHAWAESFLRDGKVRLRFNGALSIRRVRPRPRNAAGLTRLPCPISSLHFTPSP